jgi:hypothetical protein
MWHGWGLLAFPWPLVFFELCIRVLHSWAPSRLDLWASTTCNRLKRSRYSSGWMPKIWLAVMLKVILVVLCCYTIVLHMFICCSVYYLCIFHLIFNCHIYSIIRLFTLVLQCLNWILKFNPFACNPPFSPNTNKRPINFDCFQNKNPSLLFSNARFGGFWTVSCFCLFALIATEQSLLGAWPLTRSFGDYWEHKVECRPTGVYCLAFWATL